METGKAYLNEHGGFSSEYEDLPGRGIVWCVKKQIDLSTHWIRTPVNVNLIGGDHVDFFSHLF